MNVRLCFFFFLMGLFGSASIHAAQTRIGSVQGVMPVRFLTVIRGEVGESKESVVRRTARYIQDYSARETTEACGLLWRNEQENRWVIPVTTNDAHAVCVVTASPVNNAVATSETIHSHPPDETYQVNKVDRMVSGFKMKLHSRQRGDGASFSPTDLESSLSGYLVTRGRLLYHEAGTQKIEDLGEV